MKVVKVNGANNQDEPAWVKCSWCEDYWCTIHEDHVHNCPCPAIEHWDVDPYTEGGIREEEDG